MQTQTHSGDDRSDVEDVAAAIREGRSLRPAALYRIVVLDDQLHERHVDLADPVPTARQILQAAGLRPGEGYSVYAILTSGEFEDLRLDETYDLRGRGAERFVVHEVQFDLELVLVVPLDASPGGEGARDPGDVVVAQGALRPVDHVAEVAGVDEQRLAAAVGEG